MRTRFSSLCLLLTLVTVVPAAAGAQTIAAPERQAVAAAAPSSAAARREATTLPADASRTSRPFKDLFKSIGGDLTHLAARQPLTILAIGGGLSALSHPADKSTTRAFTRSEQVDEALDAGSAGGDGFIQLGAAFGVYAIGAAAHKPTVLNVGADLIEAQAVAGILTQGLKFAVRRTRPDGSHYSFPSGHTSASFVTAEVLREHFGWKVGIPAYLGAGYVAASRLAEDKHYLSDVVFGAAIGLASSRTLAFSRHSTRVQIAPVALRGGGGLFLTITPRR